MPTFTVHVPPGIAEDAARAERTAFVREGFDWPSFLFGPLGLLYRGLWRSTLAWVLAAGVLFGVAALFDLSAGPRLLLYLVLAVLTGLEAGEARRRALGRAGFIPAAVVGGATREAGERAFFGSPASGASLAAAERGRSAGGRSPVIGLFPLPGDRRPEGRA